MVTLTSSLLFESQEAASLLSLAYILVRSLKSSLPSSWLPMGDNSFKVSCDVAFSYFGVAITCVMKDGSTD